MSQNPNDPFAEPRQKSGVLRCPFQGEELPMILRHADVKQAAKDWETFSSDAPFRVPIPSEENLRTMRQLPIETNPPEHTEWRALVDPFFKRHRLPEVVSRVETLTESLLSTAIGQGEIDIVTEFALPLQCHALTYLLNVSESEGDTWLSWGIHVFDKEGGIEGELDSTLEDYLQAQFDRAEKEPGDDFYSALTQATFQGRKLTRDEQMGFANLTFAGGRDTVIHTISSIFAHFARHPEGLARLRETPKLINRATEEFFRFVSPLTHLGRVCPVETEVQGVTVPADGRVSLCWSSANHDETVFSDPNEVQLDRKPNPHIAFGAGTHFCLGAGHARLLTKTLLRQLSEQVSDITLVKETRNVETTERYTREVGYHELVVRVAGN
ncbi:MAG: cytochrome P450 [Verrucomicrobiota bacterium]